MKSRETVQILFFVLASAMVSGCAVLSNWLDPAPNMNPDAWKPSLPVDATPVNMTGSRPLRQDDQVTINVRTGAVVALEISDVVDLHGNVTLPHLGEFQVGQLTTSEAERAIRAAYIANGFFTSPDVTLVCPNMYQASEIFLTGAIMRRGSVPFRDGLTLWAAIIGSGDMTQFAGNKIKVTRGGVTETYDIRKIKSGKVKDPLLLPGDKIEVLESWL